MSTTFGVKLPNNQIIPIARRVGVGEGKCDIFFMNGLAYLLDSELELEAMDNSHQGIFTIGDIFEHNFQQMKAEIIDSQGYDDDDMEDGSMEGEVNKQAKEMFFEKFGRDYDDL